MYLKIEERLTNINYTDANNLGRIKYIVIHYFGSLGTAKDIANYFQSAYRGASAHDSLDDGDIIYRSVRHEDIAWHCGTSNGYKHLYCRNSNSIGIEVMPYKLDTSTMYASDKDWYFSEKVIDNLVEYVKYLMKKYNIPLENVIRHYDVTGKYCPRPFMGDDINSYYGVSGNEMWKRFKQRLSEEDIMTQQQFDAMMADWISRQDKLPASEWAINDDVVNTAIELGISDGQRPQGLATREEMMGMAINTINAITRFD